MGDLLMTDLLMDDFVDPGPLDPSSVPIQGNGGNGNQMDQGLPIVSQGADADGGMLPNIPSPGQEAANNGNAVPQGMAPPISGSDIATLAAMFNPGQLDRLLSTPQRAKQLLGERLACQMFQYRASLHARQETANSGNDADRLAVAQRPSGSGPSRYIYNTEHQVADMTPRRSSQVFIDHDDHMAQVKAESDEEGDVKTVHGEPVKAWNPETREFGPIPPVYHNTFTVVPEHVVYPAYPMMAPQPVHQQLPHQQLPHQQLQMCVHPGFQQDEVKYLLSFINPDIHRQLRHGVQPAAQQASQSVLERSLEHILQATANDGALRQRIIDRLGQEIEAMPRLTTNNRPQDNTNFGGDADINVSLTLVDQTLGSKVLSLGEMYCKSANFYLRKSGSPDPNSWSENEKHGHQIISMCNRWLYEARVACGRAHLEAFDRGNIERLQDRALLKAKNAISLFDAGIKMIIRHDQLATAGFETLPFLSRVRANEYVSTPPLTKNEEALLRREKAILMARGCPADRKEEDKLLVYCRLIRLPYGDIIPLVRERSVESTIRGRVRNLIRTDDERARVQSWTRNDELLFNIKMFMHDASTNGADKAKNVYNFKLIRDFIHGKGGNYFSAMAIKKQLIAVGRIAE